MNLSAKSHLRNLFGFAFPKDFYLFYEWTKQYPQINFEEDLEIYLMEIFNVFKEDFSENNLFDFIHQFRYYDDPPEFVGLFSGNTDGLHWGYYFDSPDEMPPLVVNYYHSDTYEFSIEGDSTFEAVLKYAENLCKTNTAYLNQYLAEQNFYENKIKIQKEIINLLLYDFSPEKLKEEKEDKTPNTFNNSYNRFITAPTYHQIGIVAPKETYKNIGEIPY